MSTIIIYPLHATKADKVVTGFSSLLFRALSHKSDNVASVMHQPSIITPDRQILVFTV